MKLTRILCLGAVACAVAVAAQPAAAQIQPAGTGEPLYTNSQQNTQWFEWPAITGVDAYRAQFSYYENNALKANPTYPMPSSGGTVWANWSGIAALQHGGQYGICAQGSYRFPNDTLWFPDGQNSCTTGAMLGRRASTTIDRSKPTAAIKLNNGGAYAKASKIPLRIDFADDVAGPFPANFVCFQFGGGPTDVCNSAAGYIYGYNAGCSVPATAGKVTYFTCTPDFSMATDGRVWSCVIAADASIPDNPNSSNQSATAERANLSASICDDLILDRKAPTVTSTIPITATVGVAATFKATATDATSGVKSYSWVWGDGTAATAGATATHTFTQAGTFTVTLKVPDKAGNITAVKKVVTVSAAAAAARVATTTTGPAVDGDSVVKPAAGGKPGAAKVGTGPRELPDGKFHGAKPDSAFAVR